MGDSYGHLKVNPPVRWWAKYYLFTFLTWLFARFALLGKACRFLGYKLLVLGDLERQDRVHKKTLSLLRLDDPLANREESQYGYDVGKEIVTVVNYHQQIVAAHEKHMARSESFEVYDQTVRSVSEILERDRSVRRLVNFGVGLGHVDSVLSKKYPAVEFFGIDRSLCVKSYNESVYGEVRNLKFLDGDIFEVLKPGGFQDGILYTARTLIILPPAFLRKLYTAAKAAGVRYVVGVEQLGISRQTHKAYEFSDSPKESVLFREFMFTHNYPEILRSCGYKMGKANLVKTPHPHDDYRLLSFVASVQP